MKCLFEFVPCCRSNARPVVPTSPPRARTGETRSLMPESYTESADRPPRRKRGRLSPSSSVVSREQWRPSLCAISEDNSDLLMAGKSQPTGGSGGEVIRKAGSKAKVRSYSYGDEYRPSPIPTSFSALAPTPFLF